MNAGDISTWMDLWADNGRIVVPYPPPGFPDVIEGIGAIKPGFEELFAHFTSYQANVQTVYPSLDPATAIVEWTVAAELPSGRLYEGKNITVFRVNAEGLIVEYHDYFNPEKFRLVVE